jgi:hypothetical protein
MTAFVFLLAAAFPLPQQAPPQQTGPLRTTFVTAAETVIDAVLATDPAASDRKFTAELAILNQLQQTLKGMTFDEREDDIASESANITFALTSCHLQVRSDINRLPTCKVQVDQSIQAVLLLLDVHKSGSAWSAGPPVR